MEIIMGKVRRGKDTLTELVEALCKDYGRRQALMRGEATSRRVKNELVYLNMRLFEAAGEIVGGNLAEAFIRDIGEGIGYGRTELSFFSETEYKTQKRLCVQNIAKRLFLCD
ncbi:MAG: hypothetical protein J6L90_03810 [Clostridia bacterium]|nr:hypothetical protein [Clostridia bacterium]